MAVNLNKKCYRILKFGASFGPKLMYSDSSLLLFTLHCCFNFSHAELRWLGCKKGVQKGKKSNNN